jgi:hypothetical protein
MKIHLLCAFYRKYLYKTLINYYEKENIIFHPICDSVDIEPFKDNTLDWIQPYQCPSLKIPGDQVYKKFDYFLDGNELIDDDFYGFIDDDSMYEPGFFSELRKYSNFDIVYISNYRGDKIPHDGSVGHAVAPLITRKKEDVRVDNIGLAMYFVKGRILKGTWYNSVSPVRFGNNWSGDDGLFAQKLLGTTNNIFFLSDWYVLGNYFQPGRHTDKNKFPKPNWILPEIIPTEYPNDWMMTYKSEYYKR